MKKHKFRQETEAVRGGTDLAKKNGPLSTPIYQTSTFEVTDMQEQVHATNSDSFYTRYGNPTHTVAENAIAELEGADAALLFSSGMAAITTSILTLVKAGDHIVAQRDIYGGAIKFFSKWLPKLGIETTFVDTNDIEQHESAIRPNTKILYVESPTNPTVRVVDLEKIAALARKHNLITAIDSTFSTPINCRPAEWGIDLVLHSGTKYFGGHSDLICGVAAGQRDLIDQIHQARTTFGGCMDPHAAFLLLRGIKTLAVRVERQNQSALRIAEFLSQHPSVAKVHFPLLKAHPECVTDRKLNARMLAAHNLALADDIAVDSDEYFERIEAGIKPAGAVEKKQDAKPAGDGRRPSSAWLASFCAPIKASGRMCNTHCTPPRRMRIAAI